MPTRTISSNYPQNAKVQIYGSDPNNPIQSSNGLLAVSLSGTPTVVVSGTIPVSFSGNPTVAVSGTLPVTIMGTPTVLVGNSVNIGSLPAVSLSGTPTVAISSASPLTITVAKQLPVSIAGRGVTIFNIPGTVVSGTLTSFITPAIDVSQFSDYSYFVNARTVSGNYVIQPQLAPLDNSLYYLNSGNPGVVTLSATNTNFILTDNDFSYYSRIAISGNGSYGAFTIYFQGQY